MGLTDYIPNCEQIAEADVAGFEGARIPVLTNGTWAGVPPVGYSGPTSPTDFWRMLNVDGANIKLWQQELFAYANEKNIRWKKLQYILHLLDFAAAGLSDIYYAPLGNMTQAWTWDIAAINGNVVTCTYGAGDPNPNDLTVQTFSINPNWPISGGRLLSTGTGAKLRPGGRLDIVGPSSLGGHHGWHVEEVSVDPALGVGGTFDLICSSSVGDLALEKTPHDAADPILASYRVYIGGGMAPWKMPIDIDSLWVEQDLLEVTNLISEVVLHDRRIHVWTDETNFQAVEYNGLTPVADRTDEIRPLVRITHTGANGYETKVDLSSLSFTGDRVWFTVWKETTADTARHIRCNQRCEHSIYEGSESYGQAGELGWYCRRAATASGIANYKKDCYQPNECDGFQEGLCTPPMHQSILKNILLEQPFVQEQIAGGIPMFVERRIGCPSIAAHCDLNMQTPTTAEKVRIYSRRGGYGAHEVIDDPDSTDGRIIKNKQGHEIRWNIADSAAPEILDTVAAWDGKDEELLSLAEKIDMYDSMALQSVASIDPYMGHIVGKFGHGKRCGDRDFGLLVPSVDKSNSTQYLQWGSITYGYWDANFDPTSAGAAVYFWRADVRHGIDPINRMMTWPDDPKYSVKIIDEQYDFGEGGMWVETQNKTAVCTSLIGLLDNRQTAFRTGGTNVRPPAPYTLNNQSCFWSQRGPMRDYYAYPGDTIYNETLGKRFWIKKAEPFGGQVQTWIPDENIDRVTITVGLQVGETALHYIAFDDPNETLLSVVIKRNSDTITLTGFNGGEHPVIPSLLKDQYWYQAGANGAEGVYLKYSNANITGSSADEILNILVTSSAKTYGQTFDLRADSLARMIYIYEPDYDVISIDEVLLEWLEGGVEKSQVLSQVETPASSSDLAEDKFVAVRITDQQYIFGFPYNQAGAKATITASLAHPTWTESGYYSYAVAPHGVSFPQDYDWGFGVETFEDYGSRGDRLLILDENGWINSTAFSFVGKTIDILPTGGIHPTTGSIKPTVKIDTVQEPDASIVVFGANSEIYGKTNLSDGQELQIFCHLTSQQRIRGEEMDNLRDMISGAMA